MQRFKTRTVKVGHVGVGGDNPVRCQSMTTSPTHDVDATVQQIVKLADHGCEIARVTVQGKKQAAACEHIKNRLLQLGYTIPLVADIHFYPPAAMHVAEFVDKVRINPGNFIDKRACFETISYTEKSYQAELDKIDHVFGPFIEKCKKLKKSIRIGVNHGSLSDRIMSWYGDTVQGMVESALEFARVARRYDFHDMIFSMKASNPIVMIDAYKQLVRAMQAVNWDYPLHLGVTEAGSGEDGRIKSAVGIGTLLQEGIGDTIRVSLTEDPWYEIDPCLQLIALGKNPPIAIKETVFPKPQPWMHPDGTVVLEVTEQQILSESFFEDIGCQAFLGYPKKTIATVDALKVGPVGHDAEKKLVKLRAIGIPTLTTLPPQILQSQAETLIAAACELGAPLITGAYQGLCICSPSMSLKERHSASFGILQACRRRTFKTEFIACPSCGRTLFNLQQVTEKIRQHTAHLPGVKIAIMGCIVNGPGEMADADFGYVGSTKGKVDLYVGKTRVKAQIDESEALEQLIALIKEHGRWISPPEKHPPKTLSKTKF